MRFGYERKRVALNTENRNPRREPKRQFEWNIFLPAKSNNSWILANATAYARDFGNP